MCNQTYLHISIIRYLGSTPSLREHLLFVLVHVDGVRPGRLRLWVGIDFPGAQTPARREKTKQNKINRSDFWHSNILPSKQYHASRRHITQAQDVSRGNYVVRIFGWSGYISHGPGTFRVLGVYPKQESYCLLYLRMTTQFCESLNNCPVRTTRYAIGFLPPLLFVSPNNCRFFLLFSRTTLPNCDIGHGCKNNKNNHTRAAT